MKITAKKRDIIGKNVKKIRRADEIPASIYGPDRPSFNIVLNSKDFSKAFAKVGHNIMMDLEVEGEKAPVKVLIKEVQTNPITDQVLHASLYQIDLNKKIVVEVPIEVVGESPAVKSNVGFLVTAYETIPLSCLPIDIPQKVTVDISNLNDINDAVTVKDIKLPEHVSLHSHMKEDTVLARIAPPQKEEVEEVAETPAEGAEGEAAATAEAGKEGAKAEEPKKEGK